MNKTRNVVQFLKLLLFFFLVRISELFFFCLFVHDMYVTQKNVVFIFRLIFFPFGSWIKRGTKHFIKFFYMFFFIRKKSHSIKYRKMYKIFVGFFFREHGIRSVRKMSEWSLSKETHFNSPMDNQFASIFREKCKN